MVLRAKVFIMKQISFDVCIQLLGMLSIVASLVFVGLEMRQSQSIAIAGQQQARSALANDIISQYSEMGIDFQSVYWESNTKYELSIEEIGQRNGAHSGWLLYENDFYQYKQGLMDEVTWKAKLEGIRNLYNKCAVRVVYNFREPVFSEEFKKITQSFTNECTDQ